VQVSDSASPAVVDTQDLSITISAPPPNPPLLDNFNRANENPVSQSGNWASVGINGGPGARLSSNSLRSFPSPNGGYSYRVSPYPGGNVQAAVKVTTRPSTNHHLSVLICIQDAGTAGWDGYELRGKVLSGTDSWEIRRVTNGTATVMATKSLEIATNGTMLLRRLGNTLEFWWKPSSGSWALQQSTTDTTYMWGMIGVGGYSSGVLDDFSGGSLLSLLDQYAPELRFTYNESYRADAADIATNLWHPSGPYRTNVLRLGSDGTEYAAADPNSALDDLSLDYLSTQASSSDYLSQPEWHFDDIGQAVTDYTTWVAAHPEHRRRAYGRVITDPSTGHKFLQYWMYYYYNPKNLLGIGKHEGDWEWVQMRLDARNVPLRAAFSGHGTAERCDWGPSVPLTSSGNPIVYVAHESHANYFWAGTHPRNNLPDDVTRDDGVQYREVPSVVDVTSPPGWILWDGQWGDSFGSVNSPKSPGRQLIPWDTPWTWEAEGNSCTAPPSPFTARVQSRQSARVNAPAGPRGYPSLPKIKDIRVVRANYGKAVRVSYCFGSMPTDPWRRPARLHLTIENLRDKLSPVSVGWRVTERCGSITHPVGPIKPPYLLRYAVESRRSTWSKRGQIRL
jgi:hypothetical protein